MIEECKEIDETTNHPDLDSCEDDGDEMHCSPEQMRIKLLEKRNRELEEDYEYLDNKFLKLQRSSELLQEIARLNSEVVRLRSIRDRNILNNRAIIEKRDEKIRFLTSEMERKDLKLQKLNKVMCDRDAQIRNLKKRSKKSSTDNGQEQDMVVALRECLVENKKLRENDEKFQTGLANLRECISNGLRSNHSGPTETNETENCLKNYVDSKQCLDSAEDLPIISSSIVVEFPPSDVNKDEMTENGQTSAPVKDAEAIVGHDGRGFLSGFFASNTTSSTKNTSIFGGRCRNA